MESLSELQNPLLPGSPAHLHSPAHLRSPYPYAEAPPSWSYQEKLYSYLLGGAGPAHTHQLLDPGSLQLAVEAWYRPSCLLGRDKVKEPRAGSCETSFTEAKEPQAGPTEQCTEPGQAEEDVTIHTVSYGVQEELQGQEDSQEEEEEESDRAGVTPLFHRVRQPPQRVKVKTTSSGCLPGTTWVLLSSPCSAAFGHWASLPSISPRGPPRPSPKGTSAWPAPPPAGPFSWPHSPSQWGLASMWLWW
ncbi:synapse differentiation-inducing gene protein 1-like isoform X2 [Marmota monax]|uniref:synapse differentiation-inducing gene protein 1-like isoform X2 n=1 Tax=Marmota monax TaxID=9995 RepID=UPI0026EB0D0B|nr:synapse differentiation-inducing gene protein 1-like isoform X2 [Marmota monax]